MIILNREKMDWLAALLAFFANSDQRHHLDAQYAEATAIAHELFPPMAKPLVWIATPRRPWSIAGDYCVEQRGPIFVAAFDLCRPSPRIGSFDTEAEAKAACEADNQARFREQCA